MTYEHDFNCNECRILRVTHVKKTRARRWCSWCSTWFEPGVSGYTIAGIFDYSFAYFWECEGCHR